MGRYAHDELGLKPPGHGEGDDVPAVVLVVHLETDVEYYVWDVHDIGDDEPADEPEDDGPGPWASPTV